MRGHKIQCLTHVRNPLPGAVVNPPTQGPGATTNYEEKLRVAKTTVTQDPKKVAQIVKNWVNDDA